MQKAVTSRHSAGGTKHCATPTLMPTTDYTDHACPLYPRDGMTQDYVVSLTEEERMNESRPPLPPYDLETALQKVQAAEDAWNTRDPHRVSLAYTVDSAWRNRDQFVTGRAAIVEFLTAKWERELDYALRKSLWSFTGNRIAVRFQYECHDASGQWWRSYGNELWEFDDNGLMRRREASINDVRIDEAERRLFGPRPAGERASGVDIPLR
jgi:nuclear transport factor 2 (NTF2) superfamily protein